MKKLVLLTLTTLLATGALLAGEAHVERHMKIVVGDDADTLVIEDDDLEVGETRQYFTESGKEVLITRTEEGREIEVDGKTIQIADGHHAFSFSGDAETHHAIRKEILINGDGGEGETHSFTFTTDEEGEGPHVMMLGMASAAKRLEASGVLDDLDAAKREEILEVLRSHDVPHGFEWITDEMVDVDAEHGVKVIRIEKQELHEDDPDAN